MKNKQYLSLYLKLVAIYLIIVGVFFFAAREQLYFRDSKENIKEFQADNILGDVTTETKFSQVFQANMTELEEVAILLSNGTRNLTAGLTLQLYNQTQNDILIAEKTFEPAEVGFNEYSVMPIVNHESYHMGDILRLEVSSLNGCNGDAAILLYNSQIDLPQGKLLVNDAEIPGSLCIKVTGRDEVWTGNHYTQLVLVALFFLSVLYWISARRNMNGKRDLIFSTLDALKKYSFLIHQLVSRDFKIRYKKSILGVLWSLLNPTMTMLVQYMVFSQLFRLDIDNYPVYLLSGTVVFSFFSEAVSLSLGAIVWNASLITKVYVPKYIYPVTKVLSSSINLLLSMIPLFLVAVFTGEEITKSILVLPFLLLCVIGFSIGLGMLLSALMVFFRDVQFLWNIFSMLWMYMTPLFYPETIIPSNIRWVLEINPMYYYVTFMRTIVQRGISPEPRMYFLCAMFAMLSLIIGASVFKKLQDKFILNI